MSIWPGWAVEGPVPLSKHVDKLTVHAPSIMDTDHPEGRCAVTVWAEFGDTGTAEAFRSALYEFARSWEPDADLRRDHAEHDPAVGRDREQDSGR